MRAMASLVYKTVAPLPGIDRQVVVVPGHAESVTIGDRGEPAVEGEYIIETRESRRRNRIVALVGQGWAYENIVKKVCAEFGCQRGSIEKDIEALGEVVRKLNDSEDLMDLTMADAIQKLRRLMAVNFKNATMTIDPDGLDGKTVEALFKAQINASKEARGAAETLTKIFGVRSKRWTPKQQIEVTPVVGGTTEQQDAVRRLLGEEDIPRIEEQP